MAIKFIDVSFSYGDNKIFDKLNIELPEVGMVVILGPSGSGKTTFLSLLYGLLSPCCGRILGNEIKDTSYVFQSPLLLNYLTVEENIAFSRMLVENKTEAIKSVEPILNRLNLTSLKDKYPISLSGGEQVRVSIGRALLKGGKTMILDEPTGQLDDINSNNIYSLLKEISKDHLVILVTHDENNSLKLADRLYHLENKKLILKYSNTIKNRIAKQTMCKNGSFSLKNAIDINASFLKKKKRRVILSVIFLTFNMILIYLGFNLNNNVEKTLNSLLNEYYSSDVVSISMNEKMASSKGLSLIRKSIPNKEIQNLLKIEEPIYSLSYFLPSTQEIYINKKSVNASYYPVINEKKEKLKYGKSISSIFDVIINESFLKETSLSYEEIINKNVSIKRECLVYSNQLNSSDIIEIDLPFKIVGISKEKTAFNKPIIYYSYFNLYQYLETIYLSNISNELDKKINVTDLLSDSSYDSDDFKGNEILASVSNQFVFKKKGEEIFTNINITSHSIDVKESTDDILSSLLKILLVFLFLNTISAMMLEFLSIYSLYEENIRLFALIKSFTRNKRNILKTCLSLSLIFYILTIALAFIFSLIFTYIINNVLTYLSFPKFLKSFDVLSFIFIFLLSLVITIFSSLLPLKKIKASEINKQLEGED